MVSPIELDGRGFGSIGLAIDRPRTIVLAEPCSRVEVEGFRSDDALKIVSKIVPALNLPGVKLKVVSGAPVHVGLGSSTQLGLSIAIATSRAYGLNLDPLEASVVLGRGERSGIGTYVFKFGGFVVDGGRGLHTKMPPLIFNHPFPEEWAFVVAIPKGLGLSSVGEDEAFRLLKLNKELSYRASYIITLGLIPALLEKDFEAFSQKLSELQEVVGSMFSQVQGDIYSESSREAVESIKALGIEGVGQSSWGPSVYGLVKEEVVDEVAEDVKKALKKATVLSARPDNKGARVEVFY